MPSFLRNSGSNYTYDMLNISLLTKFENKNIKLKNKFFPYPLESSVKGVYLLMLLKRSNLFFCRLLIK